MVKFQYQKLGLRRVSGRKGSCDRRVVKHEMHKWKSGKLKSGTGAKVKSQRQAVAVALSVARRKCGSFYARKQSRRSRSTSRHSRSTSRRYKSRSRH
jgi:hypothetical protein